MLSFLPSFNSEQRVSNLVSTEGTLGKSHVVITEFGYERTGRQTGERVVQEKELGS